MAAKKTQKNEDKVMVIVSRPDDIISDDNETVVAVNGVNYQIQYGEPVMVPRAVAKVIQNNKEMSVKIKELEKTVKGNKTPFAEF